MFLELYAVNNIFFKLNQITCRLVLDSSLAVALLTN